MRPGHVPTALVGPIIGSLVEERWPRWRMDDSDPSGYTILAEKIGCDASAIKNIVSQRHKGVGFDLADNILCALGRPDIWQGELRDVYLALEFPQDREAPDCFPVRFVCGHPTEPGNLQKTGIRYGKQRYGCAICRNKRSRVKREAALAA